MSPSYRYILQLLVNCSHQSDKSWCCESKQSLQKSRFLSLRKTVCFSFLMIQSNYISSRYKQTNRCLHDFVYQTTRSIFSLSEMQINWRMSVWRMRDKKKRQKLMHINDSRFIHISRQTLIISLDMWNFVKMEKFAPLR